MYHYQEIPKTEHVDKVIAHCDASMRSIIELNKYDGLSPRAPKSFLKRLFLSALEMTPIYNYMGLRPQLLGELLIARGLRMNDYRALKCEKTNALRYKQSILTPFHTHWDNVNKCDTVAIGASLTGLDEMKSRLAEQDQSYAPRAIVSENDYICMQVARETRIKRREGQDNAPA